MPNEEFKEKLDLSIVFATYNGESTLPLMLDSLVEINLKPSISWEIIAVNNNSNDNTQKILLNYVDLLPLTIITEPRPGKNISLNRALEHAQGELVIFTDDDVIVDIDWLIKYQKVSHLYPDVMVFGGEIAPYWLKKPKGSLLNQIPVGIAFALNEGSFQTGFLEPDKLWGPNMAIRKRLFEQGMRFDETIGPSGKNYAMGSETDILLKIKLFGEKAFYSNDIRVKHIVRAHQVTPEWLKGRAFRAGRGWLRSQLRNNEELNFRTVFGSPSWVLKKMFLLWFKVILNRILSKEVKCFQTEWQLKYLQGYAYEYRNYFHEEK